MSQILTFRISIKLSKQRRGKEEELKVGYIEFDGVDVTENVYEDGDIKICGESKALHYAKRKDQKFKEKVTVSSKKLFISGIPNGTDRDELCSLLGDCKISGADKGKSYVFAEYENNEKQEEALSRLNNIQFKDAKLFVTPAYEKASLSNSKLSRKRSEI